jgi:hypothetical protein
MIATCVIPCGRTENCVRSSGRNKNEEDSSGLKSEVAGSSETPEMFYFTISHHIQENGNSQFL